MADVCVIRSPRNVLLRGRRLGGLARYAATVEEAAWRSCVDGLASANRQALAPEQRNATGHQENTSELRPLGEAGRSAIWQRRSHFALDLAHLSTLMGRHRLDLPVRGRMIRNSVTLTIQTMIFENLAR